MFAKHKGLLILTFALLCLFIIIYQRAVPSQQVAKYAKQVQHYVNEQELTMGEILENKALIEYIISPTLSLDMEARLNSLDEKTSALFVYQDEQLIFWSNEQVAIDKNAIDSLPLGKWTMVNHGKNYAVFNLVKKINYFDGGNYELVGVIPLKKNIPGHPNDYVLEYNSNSWKYNQLLSSSNIPDEVRITTERTNFPIYDKEQHVVFFIKAEKDFYDRFDVFALLGVFVLLAIFLSIIAYRAAHLIAQRYHPLWAVVFMIVSSGLAWLITSWLDISKPLEIFSMFERCYADNSIFSSVSMGGMIAQTSSILAMSFCLLTLAPQLKVAPKTTHRVRMIYGTLCYILMFAAILGISAFIRYLIVESVQYYNFENIFKISQASILVLINLIIMLLVLFSSLYVLSRIVGGLQVSLRSRIAMLVASSTLCFLAAIFGFGLSWAESLQLLVFSVMCNLLFDIFVEIESVTFTWLIVWLAVFSGFSSYILTKFSDEKEKKMRMQFAMTKSDDHEQNAKLQALMQDLQKNASNLFEELEEGEDLAEYLEDKFMLDLKFQAEDIQLSAYNTSNKQPLVKEGLQQKPYTWSELQTMLHNTEPTKYEHVFMGLDSKGARQNMGVLKMAYPNKPDSLLLVIGVKDSELLDKSFVYGTFYGKNFPTPEEELYGKYEYGIYDQNLSKITAKGKDFENNVRQNLLPPKGNFAFEKGSRGEMIYHGENGKTVVVRNNKNQSSFELLGQASYIFVLLLLTTLLFIIIDRIFNIYPFQKIDVIASIQDSLRNRIQFSVISIIIIVFIAVAVTTIQQSRKNNKEYHDNRALRKAESILKDIAFIVDEQHISPDSIQDIQYFIKKTAFIHSLDVNFYDTTGVLIAASEPEVFKEGIIAPYIAGEPYISLVLKKPKPGQLVVNEEKVGRLIYTNTYAAVGDKNERLLGIIGIPYYANLIKLQEDNAEFMGKLLTLYVFLLLVSGLIAVFMANSITNPLNAIGEKLKSVRLGKRNEVLEWKSKDEIGILVGEYNRMIQKLDYNSRLLAQNEKEIAWREMAKQIAHEIKNPLTPMKLSIQYLQHAYRSNPEQIEPMLKRVTQTLIEQIDNLAQIATEFSNFAKMPKTENEHFELEALIHSVAALFSEERNADIQFGKKDMPYYVFADRNQLMRVFNNIIKNAIQAVPDDRQPKLHINLYSRDEKVIARICDNGVGIPDDMRELIFVPNFTTKNSGTGLGLAICKNIIEAMEGSIYFQTETGVGTCFFVELPRVSEIPTED